MDISKYNTLNSMIRNNGIDDVKKYYDDLPYDHKIYNLLNLDFKNLSDDMINLIMIYFARFGEDYSDDLNDKLLKEMNNVDPKHHNMINLLRSVIHH